MRTKKTVDGDVTYYFYDGEGKLIGLQNSLRAYAFYYDSNDSISSMSMNGTYYYFLKNYQGDVVAVTTDKGTIKVRYTYDSWGNTTSVTDANGNDVSSGVTAQEVPFRYRGYVYDYETGLYYLQSRYYDPETGRFISADSYCDTESGSPLSTNMYAYCENDPVNNVDPSGYGVLGKSKKSSYKRKNAVKYAKTYYINPNPNYPYYSYGDCANFVSQCLVAGGMNITDDWYCNREQRLFSNYNCSKAWSNAPAQYDYFSAGKHKKSLVTLKASFKKSKYKKLINKYNIRKGDLLYMDFNGDGKIDHATMISRIRKDHEIQYTAHTSSRFNKPISNVFNENDKCVMKIIVLK